MSDRSNASAWMKRIRTGCLRTSFSREARRSGPIPSHQPRRKAYRASRSSRSARERRQSPCCARQARSGARSSRDRKSVGEGKRVSVRVDLGGRRNIENKKTHTHTTSDYTLYNTPQPTPYTQDNNTKQ